MYKRFFAMRLSLICVKKYFCLLFLLTLFCSINPAFCADNLNTKLNEIEMNYYGYKFSGDLSSRLSRLETSIYGTVSSKNQKTRVDKLYNDMVLAAKTNETAAISSNKPQNIGPKADDGIKYPVVDKMEEQVFHKAFTNDDIYARLSRLEKQTFKKESTLSLNERVDALRSKILGGTQDNGYVKIDPSVEEIVLENGQKYYGDNDKNHGFNIDESDETSHYNYYSYENSKNHISEAKPEYSDNYQNQNYAQNYDLDILEKSLLGKRYTGDSSSKRLARLETKVFSRTFSDDEDSRIQRLLAVTTAQKTSQEYDSNKWARRLNAGMQIGSILLMVLAMIL